MSVPVSRFMALLHGFDLVPGPQMQVPEQTVIVAVETVKRVHQMWQQAQTASVIDGWGLHELHALWLEICRMGSACGKPPAAASHHRIMRILGVLGGLVEGNDGCAGVCSSCMGRPSMSGIVGCTQEKVSRSRCDKVAI